MNYLIKSNYGKGNLQAIQTCKELAELIPPPGEELVFDFKHFRENNPFGNLIIINSLKRFKQSYSDASLFCRPKEQNGYLSHIGFYKACGINYGKDPGEAIASSNYVPITNINLYSDDFYRDIEKRSLELAKVLEFDASLQEMLTYIFVETLRNVYEHADTDNVLVAAQKWPTHNLVEIAIADNGCGITGSLSKLYALDNLDLLRLACQPGITAKSNYLYLENDDPWRNSGYGLYILKELALMYKGSFILCSGEKAIRYSADGEMEVTEKTFDTNYRGTAIGIRFTTNTDNNFDEIRQQIVAKGEALSTQIDGAIKSASKSSGGRYHL